MLASEQVLHGPVTGGLIQRPLAVVAMTSVPQGHKPGGWKQCLLPPFAGPPRESSRSCVCVLPLWQASLEWSDWTDPHGAVMRENVF